MFRSAKLRESDLAERKFQAHMDHWKRTADQWFDGTVASVDERIAKMDNVIRFARDVTSRLGYTGAGFLCGNALPNLEHSRRELAAVRDSLLNGFSDRQDAPRPAGRRTAIAPIAPLPEAGVEGRMPNPPSNMNESLKPIYQNAIDNEQDPFEAIKPHLGSLLRAIVLGSRDFVADQNTDDRDELLLRARRYAAEETSTLPIAMARRISAAFVGQVEELIARRPRTRTAAAPVTHYEDFDDQLMY